MARDWRQDWPEGLSASRPVGEARPGSTRIRFTDSDITNVVAAAARSGRIPRFRQRYWRDRIAAGGTAGGTAVATLLALASVPGGVADEDVLAELWPTSERAAQAADEREARQGAEAVKFRKRNDYSNTLRVSAAAVEAMSDDEIYARLFPA